MIMTLYIFVMQVNMESYEEFSFRAYMRIQGVDVIAGDKNFGKVKV